MENKEQSVIEHLEELRKRLIIVAGAFAVSLAAGCWFAPKLLLLLKKRPSAAGVEWNLFGYTDGIMIYLKCAFLLALLISLPIALHQIWLFVKPGLTEREAKYTMIFIPVSFLLFLVGIGFSYFILFPMMLEFLSKINQSIGATETYGINQYFSLLFNLTIPVGAVFELPVVILFLTNAGIVTPEKLKHMRKVAYFILVVTGVSISPPDFISDFLIIIPLLLLFEISIWISSWSMKRKHAKNLKGHMIHQNDS
ncbi:twin-arginine translocase subunit TatC [Ureibacillus sp. FSL K6-8385]|uniref:Sec-independent protein translocase protein TatC n=1 Tax=Ureibacillus terrenus TaxID=118246 RepID=A0A540V1B5_9BACL|nr:twin-arginine translocase subunit TatC [Ureibacillus terrenus]MED3662672.1 twin-arginine translocase subunit TatC [Ureibacillus terrenus]MED3764496.1 twin-arginine translocase subunit TatC [Ureibacillus terrenus]TQE90544.1 twin-arginine translocase subunit TatC [Ureibacillus terrenus]